MKNFMAKEIFGKTMSLDAFINDRTGGAGKILVTESPAGRTHFGFRVIKREKG